MLSIAMTDRRYRILMVAAYRDDDMAESGHDEQVRSSALLCSHPTVLTPQEGFPLALRPSYLTLLLKILTTLRDVIRSAMF
ncbi:hypothetical protein LA635_2723 [Erwinia amylovora LA635]|nr:hypothetical protein AD997_03165 [Erwinia amylovora]RUT15565.1 hypothetical protein BEI72_11070 [Erwinia amylovora]CDK16347.1 hypothetical protein LA635_2723 [Erwinia amylovora LA635]CDK19713.1 hypothetical protein LA636_2721 [Erwinia amylovora LA636]CDK23085.1 hypothetical protein LA637_2725 [Erwinia amylovora LA637]